MELHQLADKIDDVATLGSDHSPETRTQLLTPIAARLREIAGSIADVGENAFGYLADDAEAKKEELAQLDAAIAKGHEACDSLMTQIADLEKQVVEKKDELQLATDLLDAAKTTAIVAGTPTAEAAAGDAETTPAGAAPENGAAVDNGEASPPPIAAPTGESVIGNGDDAAAPIIPAPENA